MTYLQHTMTQNIYYYSQREEGDHSEESLNQSKEKPYMEKNTNSVAQCLTSRGLDGSSSSTADGNALFSLGLVTFSVFSSSGDRL